MRIGLFNATPNELASELNAQQLAAKKRREDWGRRRRRPGDPHFGFDVGRFSGEFGPGIARSASGQSR